MSEVLRHKESFSREVLKEDVENLLKIPIRKISLFDIDKNSKDIKILNKELKSINSNISSIRGYSINFIDLLLAKYSKEHQRKTKISLIKSKNVKEIATKNMKVYLNLAEGFAGTSLLMVNLLEMLVIMIKY